jgi:hypothetical protein
MAKTPEEQMISDAVKGTEEEIFGEAVTGRPATEDEDVEEADRSLEEMGEGHEGQHEPEEAAADDAEDDEGEKPAGEADAEEEAEDGEEEQPRDPKTQQFKAKPEGDKKPDAKTAEQKPDDAKPRLGKDGKPIPEQGRVPSSRLREETAKRTAAETERDQAKQDALQARQDVAGLNKRLDDLMTAIASGRALQPQQDKQQQEEQAPDIFADPEGYRQFMDRKIAGMGEQSNARLDALRVEMSMQGAHERHGEAFNEAYKAVTSLDKNNPNDVQTVRRIWASPNPGRALISWHNQVKTLREVGDDPAAYRSKIETETREKLLNDADFIKGVMEKMRETAETGNNGRPRAITRVGSTPSLNSARGGGSGQIPDRRHIDGSEAGIFEAAVTDDAA